MYSLSLSLWPRQMTLPRQMQFLRWCNFALDHYLWNSTMTLYQLTGMGEQKHCDVFLWKQVSPLVKGGVKYKRFVSLETIISNLPTELLEPGYIFRVQKAFGSGCEFPSIMGYLFWHRSLCGTAAAWEAVQEHLPKEEWQKIRDKVWQKGRRVPQKCSSEPWGLWLPEPGCQRSSANASSKAASIFLSMKTLAA